VTPLCLGLVQFLQFAAKEHKNGFQNDVDDDNAGATAMTDVTIAVYNNAATASVEGDKGNHLWRQVWRRWTWQSALWWQWRCNDIDNNEEVDDNINNGGDDNDDNGGDDDDGGGGGGNNNDSKTMTATAAVATGVAMTAAMRITTTATTTTKTATLPTTTTMTTMTARR
jgi:hypothetical protein